MGWVTLAELAAQTGYPTRTLQWIRAHEPDVLVTRPGKANRTEYEQPQCAVRLRDRDVRKAIATERAKHDRSGVDHKTQKELVDLERARFLLARDLGEVVARDDVTRETRALLVGLRRQLDEMPGQYAQHILHLHDLPSAVQVMRTIAREVIGALRGIALDAEDAEDAEREAEAAA